MGDAPHTLHKELDAQIVEMQADISASKKAACVLASLGTLMVILSTSLACLHNTQNLIAYPRVVSATGILAGVFFGGLLFAAMHVMSRSQLLVELRERKRVLFALASPIPRTDGALPSYFDRLVEINVSNLDAYYGLVKRHTNNSFWVSVLAGGSGFGLIVVGLALGFNNTGDAAIISYITSGAGIVTEFITAIFFYLYNKTVRQLKEYHDSLIRVQNILLSFKIVGDTQDEGKKQSLMEMMMKCLIADRTGTVAPSVDAS